MRQLRPPSSEMYAALMSQLSIIKFGSAGEIAGVNMAPPPEMPMGCQCGVWNAEFAVAGPRSRQKPRARSVQSEHCLRFLSPPANPEVAAALALGGAAVEEDSSQSHHH